MRLVQCNRCAFLSVAFTLALTLVMTFFLVAPGSSFMKLVYNFAKWPKGQRLQSRLISGYKGGNNSDSWVLEYR